MAAQVLYFSRAFEVATCCTCGTEWAMLQDVRNLRREDGKGFYCPNGHAQFFTETEVIRLKKELERKESELTRTRNLRDSYRDQKDRAERQASAARGQVTKIKNRVHNGVCPCCNRTFQNLARHMKTKHPDFKKEQP